jgi:hypothetical protein
MSCFHHHASNLHFELTCPRLLIWATAIKNGTASFEKIPISSNLFKAEHTLKRSKKSEPVTATPPTPAPATPTPATPTASAAVTQVPGHFPMNPFVFLGGYGMVPPFGMMPNMLAIMYQQNPFHGLQTPMPTRPGYLSRKETSPDPPSSPIHAPCDVATFCRDYGLNEADEAGLENLGFKTRDDLNTVMKEEYTQAGFRALLWRRVLKAYKRFKRDNRDQVVYT